MLTIGHASAPLTLNPLVALDGGSQNVIGLLYDTLVWQGADQKFRPRLASKWEASADHKSITFTIDPNAKWSDGSPVTSTDVQATFTAVADKAVGGSGRRELPNVEGTDATGASVDPAKPLAGIEIVDPKTFRLRLKTPVEPDYVLQAIAANWYGFPVLPSAVLKGLGGADIPKAPFATAPKLTSGPFQFVQWKQGEFVELRKNPSYHLGAPKIDTVFVRLVPATSLLAELRSGNIDTTGGFMTNSDIPLSDYEAVGKLPNVKQNAVPGNNQDVIWLNSLRPALKDVRVRQALTLAIDRDQLIEKVMLKQAAAAVGPVNPLSRFHDSTLKPYPFDVARARSLLQAASYPTATTLSILALSGRPTIDQSLAIVQQQWNAVGVKSSIQTVDPAAFVAKCGAQQDADRPDVCVFPTSYGSGVVDPGQLANFFTCAGTSNYGHICDQEVDQAFKDGSTDNSATRAAAFKKMQARIYELAPIIPLYWKSILNAHSTRVNESVPPTLLGSPEPWKWDVK